MQLRNIRHFSQYQPGDIEEVPDGAEFDAFHWELARAERERPGTGEPMTAIEQPADGTMSPPLTNDTPGLPPAPAVASAQFPQPAPKEM